MPYPSRRSNPRAKYARRHYESVAAVIRDLLARLEPFERSTASRVAGHMATMFALDNPAFDRARFMDACGADDEDRA